MPNKTNGREHIIRQAAVLVTGGSGLIGRHVVKQLASSDEIVVSMYRHRLPEPMANVYPVCSDMSSPELIAAPLNGVSTVLHLAWENNFVGPAEQVDWNFGGGNYPANIRTLVNLITAMERAGTRRLIFVSAVGASRKAQAAFLREKYLAEFFILNSKIPEKIIIRSSLVCEEGSADRFTRSILRVMKYPLVYPVPKSTQEIAPIQVEGMANLLVELSRIPVTEPNAIIEVTGDEVCNVSQLFHLVSARFNAGNKFALGGMLGNSLLPLFERQSRDADIPSLKHFLALNNQTDEAIKKENPLAERVAAHLPSFKKSLTLDSSKTTTNL